MRRCRLHDEIYRLDKWIGSIGVSCGDRSIGPSAVNYVMWCDASLWQDHNANGELIRGEVEIDIWVLVFGEEGADSLIAPSHPQPQPHLI